MIYIFERILISSAIPTVVAVMFCSTLFCKPVICQDKDDPAKLAHPRTVVITNENAFMMLGKVANDLNTPIGIEIDPKIATASAGKNKVISNFEATAIVNAFVTTKPHYRWVSIKDTINVLPIASSGESILDTAIAKLDVEEKTVSEIRLLLLSAPEMRQALLNRRTIVSEETSVHGGDNLAGNKKFTLSLRNSSVRDVLNYLLSERIIRYWAVQNPSAESNKVILTIW